MAWVNIEQREMCSGTPYDDATTTQANPLGKWVPFANGWTFRYASTTTDISAGDIVVATPNIQEIAATEFGATTADAPVTLKGGTIGDNVIEIAIQSGTHAITANEYEGGYLIIKDGTGEGYTYFVLTNTANSTTAGCELRIWPKLKVALDNTSQGVLVASEFSGVKTHTAANYGGTPTEFVVGKAVVPSTAGTDGTTEYLWVQTCGTTGLQAGTATLIGGGPVQAAEDDNGSVQIPVATENRIQTIGSCLAGSTDAAPNVVADTAWGPVRMLLE